MADKLPNLHKASLPLCPADKSPAAHIKCGRQHLLQAGCHSLVQPSPLTPSQVCDGHINRSKWAARAAPFLPGLLPGQVQVQVPRLIWLHTNRLISHYDAILYAERYDSRRKAARATRLLLAELERALVLADLQQLRHALLIRRQTGNLTDDVAYKLDPLARTLRASQQYKELASNGDTDQHESFRASAVLSVK